MPGLLVWDWVAPMFGFGADLGWTVLVVCGLSFGESPLELTLAFLVGFAEDCAGSSLSALLFWPCVLLGSCLILACSFFQFEESSGAILAFRGARGVSISAYYIIVKD